MFRKKRNGKVENPQSGGKESVRSVPDVRPNEFSGSHVPDEIHSDELAASPESAEKGREPVDAYYPVLLECGHSVWGTDRDIDSGIRKHIEYCEDWPRQEETGL